MTYTVLIKKNALKFFEKVLKVYKTYVITKGTVQEPNGIFQSIHSNIFPRDFEIKESKLQITMKNTGYNFINTKTAPSQNKSQPNMVCNLIPYIYN